MRHRWPLGDLIFILPPSGAGVYIPMSLPLFGLGWLYHLYIVPFFFFFTYGDRAFLLST